VRAVQPRIVVALETPVLAVRVSGGVEKAHLRDWLLFDHRSNESSAIRPARTRFTSCSPPARGQKTFLMFVSRHGDAHLGHWMHWSELRTHPNACDAVERMSYPHRGTPADTVVADGRMVARICLPLVSLWTALRSGWRPSTRGLSLRIDRSRPRTLQQRNDIYGLENDDKMQTCISWSTSRAVPMSCTALEMRCDAEHDIQMQVGAAVDDD